MTNLSVDMQSSCHLTHQPRSNLVNRLAQNLFLKHVNNAEMLLLSVIFILRSFVCITDLAVSLLVGLGVLGIVISFLLLITVHVLRQRYARPINSLQLFLFEQKSPKYFNIGTEMFVF